VIQGEDVADSISFLLSHRARHITRTPIFIDGGEELLREAYCLLLWSFAWLHVL